MKDIDYFLKTELQFIAGHPDYGQLTYNEEIGEMEDIGMNDPSFFLMSKPFEKHFSKLGRNLGKEDDYGLTDAEKVALKMFYCRHSAEFRDDFYYDGIPEFAYEMFQVLNSLVSKAPVNRDEILYRFCVENDYVPSKVGEVMTVAHNLTCTNYDWHKEDQRNVYVITPKNDGKTKAHNLYEIYEHGDEKQVNFLRGTSFEVLKIEPTPGTEYKRIYLKEI